MIGLAGPHHDGSERYLANPVPSLGETVPVFVWVPHTAGVSRLYARAVHDGEPRYVEGRVDRRDAVGAWWRAEVTCINPVTPYRFLMDGGPYGYQWLTAVGVVHHDPPDATDFRLTSYAPPPEWLADSVVYQIFPDRFARSGAEHHLPDWAVPAAWDAPIDSDYRVAVRQLYGGDLPGIEQRLDHIEALGANLLYLTPFFPGRSAHRYDAETFDHVDPLLGGDEALVSLTRAAHARGMRVIGDLTTNHSGAWHRWFHAAQLDPSSPEASYYTFRQHPDDYVAWFGVRSLPKLNWQAAALRQALLEGPGSVVGRFLADPFDLDGWRIDVANMTGRLGDVDENHMVARAIRATMAEVRPSAWLVAEHCYDASADLRGDGWHGTMSYAGFTRPAWCWLGTARDTGLMGFPLATPQWPGTEAAATMQSFLAAFSWRSAAASLTLLDSHDTARFRSVAGSRELQLAGVGLLMTFPGTPMVFAGDEVGCEGRTSDLARVPFPWDEDRWDKAVLDGYRELVGLRRRSRALRRGGLRWAHVGDDVLVYLRETADERVLVQVSRADHDPVQLDAALLDATHATAAVGGADDLGVTDGVMTLPGDGPSVRIWNIGR